ncbi:MAG: hypothetical protein AB4050_15295 [Synechococcus sp.]
MRLFYRQSSELQQARIQAEVRSIHRFYTERVSMPRKLRQYEAKAALMRVDGFTEERAAETIATWHAAYEQRKRQRLMQQKMARQVARSKQVSQSPSRSKAVKSRRLVDPVVDPEPNTEIRRIRQAVREEARTLLALPLEKKLRACELVSHHQLEIARMEQLTRRDGSTAIEILLKKQWIAAETVRFFETILSQLSSQPQKRSIDYYLQLAGLLTAEQVAELHQASHIAGVSFAEVAESKGWVKRQTIFFINACLNGSR